ncbi:hypothetical protein LGK97_08285 [Clostridium sp. CS001]|uniref:hypothetical protein n=1 Tax=Clostridium sp. CS001 TaxID=2880648 RepID=UPI001CF114F8|nr:hypothetical protein [Clostridium sp. CS001]MCB2289762.1 hypothetical protein [Clostridium sp. CS001]
MHTALTKLDYNTAIRDLNITDVITITDKALKQAVFHLLTFFDVPFGNLLFCYKKMNFYHGYDINKITVQDVYDLIYTKGESLHYSLSTFSSKIQRSGSKAVCNSGWTIDLDYYKTEYSHLSPQELVAKMRLDGAFDMIEPDYIIFSGQGLYLVYLIKNININQNLDDLQIDINIDKRRTIIKALIKNFAKYGGDEKCHDIVRLNKMVGTVNFKTGNSTEILDFNKIATTQFKRRTLGHLYNLFVKKGYIIETEAKSKKTVKDAKTVKNTKVKTSKEVNKFKKESKYTIKRKCSEEELKPFKNFVIKTGGETRIITPLVINSDRIRDLNKLLEIRNNMLGEQHLRNEFLHIYSVILSKIEDKETVIKAITEINNKFDKPIENIDYLINQISSPDFNYNFKTETIIRNLNILDVEMQRLKTIISRKEKTNRDKTTKKVNRRNENGLTTRKQQKMDKLNAIKNLLDKGYKQVQISTELGLDKKLISKYVKQLKAL